MKKKANPNPKQSRKQTNKDNDFIYYILPLLLSESTILNTKTSVLCNLNILGLKVNNS